MAAGPARRLDSVQRRSKYLEPVRCRRSSDPWRAHRLDPARPAPARARCERALSAVRSVCSVPGVQREVTGRTAGYVRPAQGREPRAVVGSAIERGRSRSQRPASGVWTRHSWSAAVDLGGARLESHRADRTRDGPAIRGSRRALAAVSEQYWCSRMTPPNLSSAFSEAAAALVETGRRFYQRGWVQGTSGNFSAVI